ncbi:MAG TPA: ABC transporter ATP-binding protein [Coleofasciculaceae cyanobacterium]|jgi:ABC-2 type transport system ATP-binding protein
MIDVQNVVFEYPGKRALKDVSFRLEAGSITALVGPNGAGKTTLLRCIAALDEPFSGSITINGTDVLEHPRLIHRQVGYLSDFFGLYNNLTARQCLTFIAQIHQIPTSEMEQKVALAAERLEISPYLDTKAGTLSRGLRQRLGIAQAIIHEPQLLLLDEPASGLDPEARISLSDLFLSLRDQGMTLIVSSHILTELEDYCTNMLLLREGRILEHCSTHEKPQEACIEQQVEIKFLEPASGYLEALKSLEGVKEPRVQQDCVLCSVTGDEPALHRMLKELMQRELPVYSFSVRQKRLQDIYMDYAQGDVSHDVSKQ